MRSRLVTGAATREHVEDIEFTDDNEPDEPEPDVPDVAFNDVWDDATDDHVEAVVLTEQFGRVGHGRAFAHRIRCGSPRRASRFSQRSRVTAA